MIQKEKSSGYLPMLILTILFTLAGLITLFPSASASKTSFLGYNALCTFSPISTIILFVLAGTSCKIRSKYFVNYVNK
jgi:hypothetical protein